MTSYFSFKDFFYYKDLEFAQGTRKESCVLSTGYIEYILDGEKSSQKISQFTNISTIEFRKSAHYDP